MPTRDIWICPKAGAISRLRHQREPLPTLAAGKLRVRVAAVGLNFADIFALSGLYSATPAGAFIPGLEFAGTVEASAADSPLKPGDRVMGATRFGAYASVIDCEADTLRPLPADWSFAQGAAFPVATLTAWYALCELGQLRTGQRVLIHSAAGGVGLQAMQLARALGAEAVGSVGGDHKRQFLAERGFDAVWLRDANLSARLQQAPPFDLVLDAIGGRVQRASYAALAPGGRLVSFGAAEFTPGRNRPYYLRAAWQYLRRPRYDALAMVSANKSVMGFNLIWLWQQRARLGALLDDAQQVAIPPPHVGHRFDFAQATEALEYLRRGDSIGKVVLTLT